MLLIIPARILIFILVFLVIAAAIVIFGLGFLRGRVDNSQHGDEDETEP